ncbi:hypothetical protein [Tumebacillus lipolyticus]|uniref:Uncharacterized protein n=1 Tax=Tumebacillus lipolyticus TaxID=1280370 RepID=A0ABW5A075_9BACL
MKKAPAGAFFIVGAETRKMGKGALLLGELPCPSLSEYLSNSLLFFALADAMPLSNVALHGTVRLKAAISEIEIANF